MIRAVVFDCFGVIVGKGFEATYRSAGGDPAADRDFLDDMLGQANLGHISEQEFNRQLAERVGISEADWQEAVRRAEQADDELLDYITDLRRSYRTALLSNANHGAVQRRIGEERLHACFDKVVVSADVGLVKPESHMYEYVARQLGVQPSECIFLDDLNKHVRGARQAGMQAILYKDFKQAKTELDQLLNKQ